MSIENLLKTNVNEHSETKNGLTYLSWAWAWAEALKADPTATFKVEMFGDKCYMEINGTAMVWVTVTMFGKPMVCQLPVMDSGNKPISIAGTTTINKHGKEVVTKLDSFNVNTAIMRCMTKAISLHGLGLYIYAGEDLPEGAPSPTEAEDDAFEEKHLEALREAAFDGMSALEAAFKEIPVSAAKSRFWAKHQASLKDAAKQEKAA
jgi:hypothetical protein